MPPTTSITDLLDRSFKGFRPYQREAVDCYTRWVVSTREPLLIVMPTGAGKSWVIAGISAVLRQLAYEKTGLRKKVLVLAPSAELVGQNHAKMEASGFKASIFCAGAGDKSHSEDIIYATPETVRVNIEELMEYEFAGVLIDEAHRTSNQIIEAIDTIRSRNPNVRVAGLTATPYRLTEGYIYRQDKHLDLPPMSDDLTLDPYFSYMIYEVSAHYLIEQGYILPPIFGDVTAQYDTTKLVRNRTANWTNESSDEVFVHGNARDLAQEIVKEVKQKIRGGRHSAILFCQNIKHAEMVLSLLPPSQSGMISHKTPRRVRRQIIADFHRKKAFKYLVNVSTLTTGFDVAAVDVIAILRATHSASLFQQILGRGLRLSPETGKEDCLVLDYANNLGRFCPRGDPFSPEIRAALPSDREGSMRIEVDCPACAGTNWFQAVDLPGTEIDAQGYLRSIENGMPVLTALGERLAGHIGVQCTNFVEGPNQRLVRCEHRWSSVECPACGTLNTTYDQWCVKCETILGAALARMRTRAQHGDTTYDARIARVRDMTARIRPTKKQQEAVVLTLDIHELPRIKEGEDGNPELEETSPRTINVWMSPEWKHPSAQRQWSTFIEHCVLGGPVRTPSDLTRDGIELILPEEVVFRAKPPSDPSKTDGPVFYELLQLRDEPTLQMDPAYAATNP
ncbi:type III restriction protein res subunit (plasmid) [Thioalkalivibrio sp. K90mix]|uniref:DEAD/DEAH box helicase n=1 Tax=Thioalkalivibrio sp. (strain K90mix) TaxID=396595 RepID=UPI000195A717|nr:DEAD/DEAH box helicase [Thioalkalivibrio sp. K90mix]ADC73277.1 type III restriction protein res subunit [Thioalkalivibrio sp. K90mix]